MILYLQGGLFNVSDHLFAMLADVKGYPCPSPQH